jgi:hypothetical protein
MKLCKIPSGPESGVRFLADSEDVIRLPDGGFETVAVCFVFFKTGDWKLWPVLLEVWGGKWRFDPAPPDPAGTLAALVRLVRMCYPREEIGRSCNDRTRRSIRVFKIESGSFNDAMWKVAAHWDNWNHRGLQWKERQGEMKKLGLPQFEKMPGTTFKSMCSRPPLSLKYLPCAKLTHFSK